MSYYAKGSGSIIFARTLSTAEFKKIRETFDTWNIEFDGDTGEKENAYIKGKGYFDIWHPEENYHDDAVITALNAVAEIAPIESGDFDFEGEDDTYWRFIYKDSKWIEQNGRIVYDEDEPETFGTVTWCRDDIITALERMDVAVSEELVNRIFDKCANDHHFTDDMIEAGWDTLNRYIEDVLDYIRTEKELEGTLRGQLDEVNGNISALEAAIREEKEKASKLEQELKTLRTRNGGLEKSVAPENPDDDAPGDVCWDSCIDVIEDINE